MPEGLVEEVMVVVVIINFYPANLDKFPRVTGCWGKLCEVKVWQDGWSVGKGESPAVAKSGQIEVPTANSFNDFPGLCELNLEEDSLQKKVSG